MLSVAFSFQRDFCPAACRFPFADHMSDPTASVIRLSLFIPKAKTLPSQVAMS